MSSIQGNAVSYWAVKQVSPSSGVPATPAWDNLRRTSGDIDIAKSFTQSSEVDATRQPGYNVITSSEVSGSVERELSVADPVLLLLAEAAMQNSTYNEINSTGSTTFSNSGSTITQTDAFATAVVGQYFVPFDSALNERVFTITAKTSDDEVVVSPAPVDETVSATIVGKSIRNSNVPVGMSVQKRIPTDSGTIYKTFTGCQIGSMSVSITSGSIVTMNYDLMGLGQSAGITQISGASDNTVNASRVTGSVKDVVEFFIDGSPQTPAEVCYTDFTFSLDNGAQSNAAIGKEGACSISFGAAAITGTLTSYVDGTSTTTAQSEITKRDNETLFGLGAVLKDTDGNYLVISMPAAQYTEVTQSDTANGDTLKNSGTYGATGKSLGYAAEFNFIAKP
tara:strand:+ start:1108 stop:2289 length:1182 start_codon:yes stop_codon:yes gene_type:complete